MRPSTVLRRMLDEPEIVTELLGGLQDRHADVRYQVLKSLNRIRRRHPDWPVSRELLLPVLQREGEVAYRIIVALNHTFRSGENILDPDFLKRALGDRLDKTVERIFRIIGLLYSRDDIHSAFMALRGNLRRARSNAAEYMDHTLESGLKPLVFPLISPELDLAGRTRKAMELFPQWKSSPENPWPELLDEPDKLLRISLLSCLNMADSPLLRDRAGRLREDEDPEVRQAADRSLQVSSISPEERKKLMSPLSLVDKWKSLQMVDIFSRTDL